MEESPTRRMLPPESQPFQKLRKCSVEGSHDLAERSQPRLTGSPFQIRNVNLMNA